MLDTASAQVCVPLGHSSLLALSPCVLIQKYLNVASLDHGLGLGVLALFDTAAAINGRNGTPVAN